MAIKYVVFASSLAIFAQYILGEGLAPIRPWPANLLIAHIITGIVAGVLLGLGTWIAKGEGLRRLRMHLMATLMLFLVQSIIGMMVFLGIGILAGMPHRIVGLMVLGAAVGNSVLVLRIKLP